MEICHLFDHKVSKLLNLTLLLGEPRKLENIKEMPIASESVEPVPKAAQLEEVLSDISDDPDDILNQVDVSNHTLSKKHKICKK